MSLLEAIKFVNPTEEDFVGMYDGHPYEIPAKSVKYFAPHVAEHFAKHLVNKILTKEFEELCKEIDKGGYWSIPKMQEWIEKHHHKAIPEQTVWYRMDQLSYSYKGARPHPVQGNKDKQEAFKKGALLPSWSR